jgi:hypothetical protein
MSCMRPDVSYSRWIDASETSRVWHTKTCAQSLH